VQQGVSDPHEIFETLAVEDIQMAADVLRPVYDRTNHVDGYISLEVSPVAANDTQKTIEEARHLFKRVNRPNVMIKIPATAEGMPAIEQMIYEGVNINITLIFDLGVYERVTEAYIRGLEHRMRDGLPVKDIASVASFFVSRVDTMVDKLLDEKIAQTDDDARKEELRQLQGKAAIANARLAYGKYKDIFHGPRFAELLEKGAAVQRPLWASTSTKNPAYRDVMYVEELIGPETVDTMPPQTIKAFQDHGEVKLTLTPENIAASQQVMDRLASVGIDMAQVTKQLEIDGVRLFVEPYNSLMQSTAAKTDRLRKELQATGSAGKSGDSGSADASAVGAVASSAAAPTANPAVRQQASLGGLQSAVDAALDRADRERFAQRVWEHDPTLWKPNPAEQNEITNRLGWLTVIDTMRDALPRLNALRDDVRNAGFTGAVLLGMGGSSLAPEVLRETFGVAQGQPRLHVLDSTDPDTILSVERDIDLAHTLFIVASKSGGTIETLSHFAYFYDKVHAVAGDQAGQQFIAITDPGTKLEQMGRDHQFREIFLNPPEIGGRYSALSFFGLVPGAIIGLDVATLLDRADAMRRATDAGRPARENPGVYLGAIMGALANKGHDKLTLVVSPPISTFGYWAEQLIAESTGKENKGIVPVEGETLGPPSVYGNDRLFVYVRTDEGADPHLDEQLQALEAAGQPVVRLSIADRYDMGGEFFRWEFATAIAGAFLDINPFDQPNVQEAKDATNAILNEYIATKRLPQPSAILRTSNVTLIAGEAEAGKLADSVSLQAAIETFIKQVKPGDYIALLAYIERASQTQDALQHIRLRLRDLRRVATTLGYGPRFQHSTGQLHKGDPNTGIFLQFVANDQVDLSIPGQPYTFGVLKQAQALGDLQSLQAHGRRVIRIDLGNNIAAGLSEVRQATDAAHLE
ncbi:MAG: bifunctional transaldolase/phosoglucose isomerase, partial [Ktedonobacterales bacterium]